MYEPNQFGRLGAETLHGVSHVGAVVLRRRCRPIGKGLQAVDESESPVIRSFGIENEVAGDAK